MPIPKTISKTNPKKHKSVLKSIVFVFLFLVVSTAVVLASESSNSYKKTVNASKETEDKPVITNDLQEFLKYSINKECGKTNNLKKSTIKDILITENKVILANINAEEGINKSDTKDKILEDTLKILKAIKDKDYKIITFAYYLPSNSSSESKDSSKSKIEDQQVFTIVFDKNQIINEELSKMNHMDLHNIAKSSVTYPYLK